MNNEQQEILAFFNSERTDGEKVTLETAKGMYIPRDRTLLESRFPKQLVEDVFSEPNHLEKAETMLLKIEKMELDEQVDEELKREYLINVAYELSNACGGELDSNNPIWEKYAILYAEIPIEVIRYDKMPLWYPGFQKETMYVTADELKVAHNWLSLSEAKTNLPKAEYLSYIFRLVHISLQQIFKEVKSEILG